MVAAAAATAVESTVVMTLKVWTKLLFIGLNHHHHHHHMNTNSSIVNRIAMNDVIFYLRKHIKMFCMRDDQRMKYGVSAKAKSETVNR